MRILNEKSLFGGIFHALWIRSGSSASHHDRKMFAIENTAMGSRLVGESELGLSNSVFFFKAR